MRVCRVIGTVVASAKHPAFTGHKLLVCQPLNEALEDEGAELLAVDRAQSGIGDNVLVISEGSGARQMIGTIDGKLPIRSVIIGHVDEVSAP